MAGAERMGDERTAALLSAATKCRDVEAEPGDQTEDGEVRGGVRKKGGEWSRSQAGGMNRAGFIGYRKQLLAVHVC